MGIVTPTPSGNLQCVSISLSLHLKFYQHLLLKFHSIVRCIDCLSMWMKDCKMGHMQMLNADLANVSSCCVQKIIYIKAVKIWEYRYFWVDLPNWWTMRLLRHSLKDRTWLLLIMNEGQTMTCFLAAAAVKVVFIPAGFSERINKSNYYSCSTITYACQCHPTKRTHIGTIVALWCIPPLKRSSINQSIKNNKWIIHYY